MAVDWPFTKQELVTIARAASAHPQAQPVRCWRTSCRTRWPSGSVPASRPSCALTRADTVTNAGSDGGSIGDERDRMCGSGRQQYDGLSRTVRRP